MRDKPEADDVTSEGKKKICKIELILLQINHYDPLFPVVDLTQSDSDDDSANIVPNPEDMVKSSPQHHDTSEDFGFEGILI